MLPEGFYAAEIVKILSDGGYGFAKVLGWEREVFVHLADGREIVPGPNHPVFGHLANNLDSRFGRGKTIILCIVETGKGPRAYPWGFKSEWETAERAITTN